MRARDRSSGSLLMNRAEIRWCYLLRLWDRWKDWRKRRRWRWSVIFFLSFRSRSDPSNTDLRRFTSASAVSQLRRSTATTLRRLVTLFLPSRVPSSDHTQLCPLESNVGSQSSIPRLDRFAPVPRQGGSQLVARIDEGLRLSFSFA